MILILQNVATGLFKKTKLASKIYAKHLEAGLQREIKSLQAAPEI